MKEKILHNLTKYIATLVYKMTFGESFDIVAWKMYFMTMQKLLAERAQRVKPLSVHLH